jgi:hypothetical protein
VLTLPNLEIFWKCEKKIMCSNFGPTTQATLIVISTTIWPFVYEVMSICSKCVPCFQCSKIHFQICWRKDSQMCQWQSNSWLYWVDGQWLKKIQCGMIIDKLLNKSKQLVQTWTQNQQIERVIYKTLQMWKHYIC